MGDPWRNLLEQFYPRLDFNHVISCSDSWGETKLSTDDKLLNVSAPIPYMSGWGAEAFRLSGFKLVPSIEACENAKNVRQIFFLMLKAVQGGEKVAIGGGIGSMFYMICKYFTEPDQFYREYYKSMNFGLAKTLLYLKILQTSAKHEKKNITSFLPFKGIMISGMDTKLYMDYIKKEFGLEPLNAYGATEGGNMMRGDPDRKTDLLPNLRSNYLEFKAEDGTI